MREHFIFYRSFLDTITRSPDVTEQNKILRYLVDCALGVIEIGDVPYPIDMAIDQMMVSVDRSQNRYEKAVEDGKRGGRPSKQDFIPPDVWIGAIEKHGSIPKAAKSLGLSPGTLYNWVNASSDSKIQKFKNLTVSDSLSDSVSVSESVSVSDSDKRNINKNNLGNGTADADAPPRTEERNAASRREDNDYEPTQEESLSVIRRLIADTQEKERVNGNERERDTS